MFGWMDYQIAHLRYEELLQEAEEYRMVHLGSPRQLNLAPCWHVTLWLGKILIAWGMALKRTSNSKLHEITVGDRHFVEETF